ncbi:hypothetical protein [Lentzea jiangxiensis]|nr:hypothetical protein [Lentzea jiangxiensis]
MRNELAALAAEVMGMTREPWEYLLLRATVRRGALWPNDRMNHRLTSGPSEEHVRCKHPQALRALPRDCVLEMRIERDGTFEALLTNGIKQFTGYLPPSYTVVVEPRPRELFEPHERVGVVSDGPLAHVEAALGARIPADVHDLYRGGRTTLGGDELIPADEILAVHRRLLERGREKAGDPRRWHSFWQLAFNPPGTVRPVPFHPLWVPISRTPGYHGERCVDLAPGPAGRVGQVLDDGVLRAGSVEEWCAAPMPRGIRAERLTSPTPARIAAVPRDAVVLEVDAAEELDLTALDLTALDLTALDLPSLGRLKVRAGRVRVGDLPIRDLEVHADEVELGALDRLTTLRISGARVELPPLPSLRVLHAAEAEVDVVPDGLDYLALNAGQWSRCKARPAAARLYGERSLARALD